ncbi:hypothetical protein PQY66_04415, partial [Luminiphilus sp.]|nr:hypothetical protein [Luminiphilus sp.]
LDTDQDGIGNNADPDDDGDGVLDQDDAFPLDPDESADTDGDGIGDVRDDDDDDDGILDSEDDSPRGEGYLDSDGDGVINNLDSDSNGDGVPDALEGLIAGELGSITMVVREPSIPNAIPSHATGYGFTAVKLNSDGTYVSGQTNGEKDLGNWTWNIGSQSLVISSTEPRIYFGARLNEDEVNQNVDWESYASLGSPELNVAELTALELELGNYDSIDSTWIVARRNSVKVYVDQSSEGAEDFVIDIDSPIISQNFDDNPAVDQLIALDALAIPFSEDEIIGEWAIGAIVPGAVRECAGSSNTRCSQIFEFKSSGIGFIDDRRFDWAVGSSGSIAIEMTDGTGSLILTKVSEFTDGSVSVLVNTGMGGDEFIYHSHAIKRDLRSIDSRVTKRSTCKHYVVDQSSASIQRV